jgi:hypothetical protein
VEDWQQWQIRADEVAAGLNKDVDSLEHDFFGAETDATFRAFWPRFRDLKERVRVAPAIKLDDKLALERRLRGLGSRAYKAQEATYAQSGTKKTELLETIGNLRTQSETLAAPRELRELRRELDAVRTRFDAGSGLVPADRQAVWDAWRDTNQFVWQRLNELWAENETYLREIVDSGRQDAERGNAQGARQAVGRFFEALRTHEAKQASINVLKGEAESIRHTVDEIPAARPPEHAMPDFRLAEEPSSGRGAPEHRPARRVIEHGPGERRPSERRNVEHRTERREYRAAESRGSERRGGENRGSEHRAPAAYSTQQSSSVPALESWRTEADRNREAIARLQGEVDALDREFQASESILEQAMIRGNLVDKRRKLSELERSTRALDQRIERSEDVPLIPVG